MNIDKVLACLYRGGWRVTFVVGNVERTSKVEVSHENGKTFYGVGETPSEALVDAIADGIMQYGWVN